MPVEIQDPLVYTQRASTHSQNIIIQSIITLDIRGNNFQSTKVPDDDSHKHE